jgi:thiamine transporter
MHFLSGIILFAEYDQVGFTPVTWSLAYNGSYMIPEIILTTAVAFLISRIPSANQKISNQ